MVDTPSLVTLFIHLKVTLCCPSRTSTLLGDWPSTHLAAVSTWSAEMRAPPHLHNPKGIILLCTDLNCNFTKEWCQWSLELPMPLAMDTHSPQCPGLQLFCSRWVLVWPLQLLLYWGCHSCIPLHALLFPFCSCSLPQYVLSRRQTKRLISKFSF